MAPLIAGSVVLLLVHIGVQAITVTREFGSTWNAGPRDEELRPKGVLAGRAERALRNYLETFPAFGILALTLAAMERVDGLGLLGALLWLVARIVYLPLYLAGIPYWRSLVWSAAAVGLLLMVVRTIL
ncbi:MAPEG family protein [Bosea vestrisii]|uniref:MAPEG family protein n=1 Tax=Bosea vestrisii TaxID=151416 RepID=UPI0024DF938C|nr:MAPEG family protein [Bosea vestrisii]WID99411.1 MAPEG family protein [Bosea vestrisii]